jgi:ribosome-associated protein
MSFDEANPNLIDLGKGVMLPAGALSFGFSRSGGPGGQNVNKLNTRATLTVLLSDLETVMPPWAITRLLNLAGPYRAEGRLVISAADSRSQVTNREACVERLADVVQRAMTRPRVRRKTKPSAGSVRRRIKGKKERGQTKQSRQQNRRPSMD